MIRLSYSDAFVISGLLVLVGWLIAHRSDVVDWITQDRRHGLDPAWEEWREVLAEHSTGNNPHTVRPLGGRPGGRHCGSDRPNAR